MKKKSQIKWNPGIRTESRDKEKAREEPKPRFSDRQQIQIKGGGILCEEQFNGSGAKTLTASMLARNNPVMAIIKSITVIWVYF